MALNISCYQVILIMNKDEMIIERLTFYFFPITGELDFSFSYLPFVTGEKTDETFHLHICFRCFKFFNPGNKFYI